MDALDLEILHHMGMDPWAGEPPDPRSLSPTYLADRVGTTPETVRERVRRMEDQAVIAGYQAYPEPGQLDLMVTPVMVTPETSAGSRRDLVEELCLLEGILEVHDLRDDALLLTLGHRTQAERDRRVALVARRTRADPWVNSARTAPGDLRPLSHLDWRIVQALRGRADRSPQEVADEVGVSYRTVKRHLDRMLGAQDLAIVPQVRPEQMTGVLPFDLVLVLERDAPDRVTERALNLFPDRRLKRYRLPSMPRYVMLFVYAESLAEVDAMEEQALALDGVQRAMVLLTRASHETGWLDERIELKVLETAPEP